MKKKETDGAIRGKNEAVLVSVMRWELQEEFFSVLAFTATMYGT